VHRNSVPWHPLHRRQRGIPICIPMKIGVKFEHCPCGGASARARTWSLPALGWPCRAQGRPSEDTRQGVSKPGAYRRPRWAPGSTRIAVEALGLTRAGRAFSLTPRASRAATGLRTWPSAVESFRRALFYSVRMITNER
jgi:hypothetical protein